MSHPRRRRLKRSRRPRFSAFRNATSNAGDMAVATGNTLMKSADSLVQKAPPPLPPFPVQLDRQPAILHQVVPESPAWAEEQGVTAIVKLLVTIDAKGQVQNVDIVSSGGNDLPAMRSRPSRRRRSSRW